MVREFVSEDYELIRTWYAQHGQEAPPYDVLPTYGLIDDKKACGFLITTDSCVGILEFFIGNPRINNSERRSAIDIIVEGLISRGTAIGLKYFQCSTQIAAVRERALKHDFKYVGEYGVYAKGT